MSDHLPQCWTQDIGGMKRASAESCAVCDAIRSAVADALHEYDKQTYERCAGHMRTARAEALDAAREAVAASSDHYDLCICDECCGTEAALAAIDALREENRHDRTDSGTEMVAQANNNADTGTIVPE